MLTCYFQEATRSFLRFDTKATEEQDAPNLRPKDLPWPEVGDSAQELPRQDSRKQGPVVRQQNYPGDEGGASSQGGD